MAAVSGSDGERHRVFDAWNNETRVREFDQFCVELVFVCVVRVRDLRLRKRTRARRCK